MVKKSADMIIPILVKTFIEGEGGSPLKISKTWLRDSGWTMTKRSTQWAYFLVGFGGPRQLGARLVDTPIFPPKVAQKSKMKNKRRKLDFSWPIDK